MNLFGSTISDELRLSNNLKSRVYSVALNEKAAVLGGGHLANSAWWFDIETGSMMTSSFYKEAVPDWVTEFNSKKFADIYLERKWELTLPIDEYTESLREPNTFKIPFDSRNTSFPYDLKRIRGRASRFDLLTLTPYGNTFTKDFALSLLVNEELGRKDHTDFLFLSFSANSNIGHRFGILSIELQDAYLQLDQDIAHFLSFIDENYGKENVLIVFTSDRGANHNPGYLENIRMPSGTFNQMQAMILLRSYMNATLGNGDWVKGYHSRQIYLNHQLIEDSKLSLVELQGKVARFMIQLSGISAAVPSYILQQNYFGSGLQHKMQNGYNQKRSGDVIIALQPGWNERNSNINSSNALPVTENHVPLVLFGWKMNRIAISRPVDITGVTPTLAILLGISPPQVSTGPLLHEVIR
jgi:predicted AlkP superfamily pyrophosphatase or phosphodiesterase